MKKDERWSWVFSISIHEIEDKHTHLTLCLNKKPCKSGNCKGCRSNPYCLNNSEENKWINFYKEMVSTTELKGENKDDEVLCNGDNVIKQELKITVPNIESSDDQQPSDVVFYRGLKNYGNTCYMNALIQIYYRIHDLRSAVYVMPSEIDDAGVIGELQNIFGELQLGIGESVEPFGLVQALSLPELEQQDAPEFHHLFINLLDSRFKILNEFLIRNLFFGEMIYQTRCLSCQYMSERQSDFQELDLKIEKGNLLDCIEDFFKVESLVGDNQYQCYPCGNLKRDGERQTVLKSLPPHLSIQLLRFSYDLKSGRKKKNSQIVQIPELIDLNPYVQHTANDFNNRYILKALLLHIGSEPNSGHYITLVRDHTLDWIYCNDSCAFVIPQANFNLSKVSPTMTPPSQNKTISKKCSVNEAVSSNAPADSQDHWNPHLTTTHSSKTAYMLFYEREDQFVDKLREDYKVDVPKHIKFQVEQRNIVLREELQQKRKDDALKAERSKEECKKMVSLIHLLRIDDESEVDLEFLPTRWYSSFLKEGIFEVTALDKWPTKLICLHGKLSPFSSIHDLRVVTKRGVDKLVEENLVLTRMPMSSICTHCVLWNARLLKFKAEAGQICKEIDQYFKSIKNNNTAKPEIGQKYFWIGKDTLKTWRGIAKKNIDRFYQSLGNESNGDDELKVDGNMEEDNEREEEDTAENDGNEEEDGDDSGDLNFNEDLFCSHGHLTLDSNKRKLLPEYLWNSMISLIKTYTPAEVMTENIPTYVAEEDISACRDCLNLNTDYQGAANLQKESLSDLIQPNKKRPHLNWDSTNGQLSTNAPSKLLPNGVEESDTRGPFFLVPSSFLSEWRRYVKRPDQSTVPSKLSLKNFLCSHNMLMSTPDELGESSEVTFLWPHEWLQLSDYYPPDSDPISLNKERGEWVSQPVLCDSCYIHELRLKQQYSNERITVRLLSQEEFMSDSFVCPSPSKKSKLSLESNSSASVNFAEDFGVRRSSRARKLNSDRSIRVSSDMTVRSLKVQIMNMYGITPSDQYLKHNQRDLSDAEESLLDANIRPGDVLYLWSPSPVDSSGQSFDANVYNSLPTEEPAIEVGFKGSKLMDM